MPFFIGVSVVFLLFFFSTTALLFSSASFSLKYCCATLKVSFRDAVSEMALHFLAKMKIMVVKDIERDDIEFYSRILGCRPVASVDHFVSDALGYADVVEQITTSGDERVIQVLTKLCELSQQSNHCKRIFIIGYFRLLEFKTQVMLYLFYYEALINWCLKKLNVLFMTLFV